MHDHPAAIDVLLEVEEVDIGIVRDVVVANKRLEPVGDGAEEGAPTPYPPLYPPVSCKGSNVVSPPQTDVGSNSARGACTHTDGAIPFEGGAYVEWLGCGWVAELRTGDPMWPLLDKGNP